MRQAFTELPTGWLATIQEQHLAVQKAVSSHPKAQDLNFESSANKAYPRRKEAQGISQIRPHGPSVSPAGPDAPGTFGKTGVLPLETAALAGVHGLCKKLISQIIRRVHFNETIPHHEKIFSIFEPHTEWISKGKAGVPVELGLRVNLIEDQDQFILHHQVMRRQTDEKVAVEIVEETKKRFPELAVVSWDKGAHSPQNQRELKELPDLVVLPKKSRLSHADRQREDSREFKLLRRKHSAVESAINALEVHGLDRCPDHGIKGFERYVALAVLAKNIHRLGTVLREQQKERQCRKRGPYKKAA